MPLINIAPFLSEPFKLSRLSITFFLRQSSSCTNTVAVELQMSWQNLFFFKNVTLFELALYMVRLQTGPTQKPAQDKPGDTHGLVWFDLVSTLPVFLI